MNEEILTAIRQHKIIAIVRGVESSRCMKVAEALYQGGIRLIEITYNQSAPETWKNTASAIGEVADAFSGKMFVGAGTVTNTRLVALTAEVGGRFIISPNTNAEVIRETKRRGLVSIPGAMTPSEILAAHDAGADFVKLFPASDLGIGYLKAVRAPISHVGLIATGGISEANARAFLDAGAVGLGVGGSLANKKAIENEDYEKLTQAAEALITAIH
jgi:2-dehydro-3-deoxyphosphogluconate aldolase/(4S)-4-hydroxy-2-oxoglutarate aldolase